MDTKKSFCGLQPHFLFSHHLSASNNSRKMQLITTYHTAIEICVLMRHGLLNYVFNFRKYSTDSDRSGFRTFASLPLNPQLDILRCNTGATIFPKSRADCIRDTNARMASWISDTVFYWGQFYDVPDSSHQGPPALLIKYPTRPPLVLDHPLNSEGDT